MSFIPMIKFESEKLSSLQCHTILRRSFYNDDLLLKEHFWLLSILKTVLCCFIFLWKQW